MALVDQLSYFNSSERGFVKLTIEPGKVVSDWVMLDTILDKDYKISIDNTTII